MPPRRPPLPSQAKRARPEIGRPPARGHVPGAPRLVKRPPAPPSPAQSRSRPKAQARPLAGAMGVFAEPHGERTLVDLIDNLLNRGVVLHADAILSLADVDLVYLRLTALLVAADRVFPPSDARTVRSSNGRRGKSDARSQRGVKGSPPSKQ